MSYVPPEVQIEVNEFAAQTGRSTVRAGTLASNLEESLSPSALAWLDAEPDRVLVPRPVVLPG